MMPRCRPGSRSCDRKTTATSLCERTSRDRGPRRAHLRGQRHFHLSPRPPRYVSSACGPSCAGHRGDQIAVTDLTRLECRVKPMAVGDAFKLGTFDAFFGRPDIRLVALDRAVYDQATALRATHRFKLGD